MPWRYLCHPARVARRELLLLVRRQIHLGGLACWIPLHWLLHNLCLDQFHDLKWFGRGGHGGDGLRSAKLCCRRIALVVRTAIADEPSLKDRYFVLGDTNTLSPVGHVESVDNLKNPLLMAAASVAIPISHLVSVGLASANPH